MQDIIRLLPDSIANQIAAGEVVQRPASVVKELLENAIDAQASRIELIIKEAGKILIQVIDNGVGMSPTDARMSFERHATSKIKTSDDLFNIRTMGFRGEALASIAAVAQVELKSRRAVDELGTFLKMEGSELKSQEVIPCQPGTSLAVKNLFFNVPARRNFLKSNPVEMRHILDEFQRVALAHPEVEMSLVNNESEIYNLTKGKLSHRIVQIFGKNYREQLITCQEDMGEIKLQGYIGKPEEAKKTRGEQFFFVNNRFIKHSYLHHAVMTAYQDLITKDAYPFYVLFFEIAPVHIDINVHPTKTEIKFDDERTIYALLNASVRKALGSYNITPSLDFETDVNFNTPSKEISEEKYKSFESLQQETSSTNYYPQKTSLQKSNETNWQKIFEGLPVKQSFLQQDTLFKENPETLTFESRITEFEQTKPLDLEQITAFQLHNRYIITQVKSGLMIIDQHLAHQRILYDKYLKLLKHQEIVTSQQLLFPVTIEFNASDVEVLIALEKEIKELGFVFDILGSDQIRLWGIPSGLGHENEKEIFESFIEQFKNNQAELTTGAYEKIARLVAQRTALKYGSKLSTIEMHTLIAQLFASSNPNYTPEGEATLKVLDMIKIVELFNA